MPARLSPLRLPAPAVRARDEAVSAVSLPEKKPDKDKTNEYRKQRNPRRGFHGITLRSTRSVSCNQEGTHVICCNIPGNEALADPPRRG